MTTPPPPAPMTRLERLIGTATGRALAWLATRAATRRDWHEANHCLAALAVGASDHRTACGMPHDRPITARPVVAWEPHPDTSGERP